MRSVEEEVEEEGDRREGFCSIRTAEDTSSVENGNLAETHILVSFV